MSGDNLQSCVVVVLLFHWCCLLFSFECRVFVRVVGVDRDDVLVVPLLDPHPLARRPRARPSAPLANDRLAVHSVWSSARGPVHPSPLLSRQRRPSQS